MKPNIQKTSISSSYFNDQYNKHLGHKDSSQDKKGTKFFAPSQAKPSQAKGERKLKTVDFRAVLGDSDSESDGDDGPWLKAPKKLSAHDLETETATGELPTSAVASSSSILVESQTVSKPAPLLSNAFDPKYPVHITPLESNLFIQEPDQDQEKWDKINERKNSTLLPPRPARGSFPQQAFSYFYGEGTGKKYDGSAWTSASKADKASMADEDSNFYLPKKSIQTIRLNHFSVGGTAAVSSRNNSGAKFARFSNQTGNLLLVGDLSGQAFVFSNNQSSTYSASGFSTGSGYNLLRSYHGHTQGLHTGEFSPSNLTFLTSSYDRYMRVWDTETGQAAVSLTNRLMNYSAKFSPYDSNTVLAGTSNNRIFQWDLRSGKVVQEYNYHLNFINDLTYIKRNLDPALLERNLEKDRALKQLEDELAGLKLSLSTEKNKLEHLDLQGSAQEAHEQLLRKSVQAYQAKVGSLTGELQELRYSEEDHGAESASLKFVSCSDDNKLLYWENRIPVPIKYLQDSELYTITSLLEHPTQSFLLGKSIANKVLLFSYNDTNLKLLKNYHFALAAPGATSTANITSMGFSPNGKFFLAGDSQGGVTVWDWKSRRILKKLPAHTPLPSASGALVSSVSTIDWHPSHPTRLATACLNGEVKIWE